MESGIIKFIRYWYNHRTGSFHVITGFELELADGTIEKYSDTKPMICPLNGNRVCSALCPFCFVEEETGDPDNYDVSLNCLNQKLEVMTRQKREDFYKEYPEETGDVLY